MLTRYAARLAKCAVALTRVTALLTMAALVGGLACAGAFAAVDDGSPVTLDLKDVEVKSAIDALFRGRPGMNFSVSQDVSGIVPSLSISNVPFDAALKSLLKTSGLVYRIENGVYMISKRPDASSYAGTTEPGAAAAVPGAVAMIDSTTTVESTIDRVPLTNMSATEMLSIMNGGNQQYGGYGLGGSMGMMGSMGYGSMGYGGMNSYGSGYGGRSNYGGGYGYGGVPSYGGGYGSRGGYSPGYSTRGATGGGVVLNGGAPVGGGVPAMAGVVVAR